MKRRWLFFPVIGVLIIGIILGSFYDLQINSAIYDEHNGFAMFMSAFGEFPTYAFMGTLGFGFVFMGLKYYQKPWQRLILFGLAALTAFFCIYFQGKHIFDENAYYTEEIGLKILGFVIGTFTYACGVVGGYFLIGKHTCDKRTLFWIIVTLAAVMALSNGINQLTKLIMCRPRYRMLANMGREFDFKNWWENGRSLKAYYKEYFSASSENFKSFPSGHLTNCMAIFYILPMLKHINNRVKINEYIGIAVGFSYCILMAFSRMLCGAHYLSDVSMGALITALLAFVGNEIYLQIIKKGQPQVEEQVQ